jgi:hypothetical protein
MPPDLPSQKHKQKYVSVSRAKYGKVLSGLIFMIFFSSLSFAQSHHKRTASFDLQSDTIKIDSLSVVPGTVIITAGGKAVDSTLYKIDYARAELIPAAGMRSAYKKIEISYEVFPIDFTRKYYHKKYENLISSDSLDEWYYYSPPRKTNRDIFNLNGFQKSGSISRAVSAGNSQNLSVASDMNLQLSGMIAPGLKITAVVTDNNIPIQPDGNTQQLQDFDRVFIRLDHKNGSLTAGDFMMTRPRSYFLNYNKKSQGVKATAAFDTKKGKMTAYAGAAISRGNYNRYFFRGTEGNQGPYKLQGANNERYIVVLSGTEKVYMDGKLLTRGESNDYIINYNTAEITFMPRIIVTKDKRFSVEFEYSVRYYTRATVAGGAAWEGEKFSFSANIFSEGDMKNQPIDKALSPEEKAVMEAAGDSIWDAVIPSVDSTGFNADRVMYKMVDSLGYDSVFVYSQNKDSAVYQLTFSYVGAGKGDYVRENTAANGRVYRWVAPAGGVHQGEYAPVRLLVTPKKQQMITAAAGYRLGKTTKLTAEAALSVKDINTFSALDAADNNGVATIVSIDDKRNLTRGKLPWQLSSKASYQFVQKDFSPVERFRSVEFNRDWNGLQSAASADEHLLTASVSVMRKNTGIAGYSFESYNKGVDNRGLKNGVNIQLNKNGWEVSGVVNNTNTYQKQYTTGFLRHNALIAKNAGAVKIGIRENAERNRFVSKTGDILLPASFSFEEYGGFITTADTSFMRLSLDYKHRNDSRSDSASLLKTTSADDFIAEVFFLKNPNNTLRLTASYRLLNVSDTVLSPVKPDESTRGRIEHRLRLFKGAVRATTFYETNSGLEIKKEYSYLQVAPGQGVYSWTDYNDNGIKELDEFEIAAFQDKAEYIRILIPSNEYIKTYGNRFNTSISLTPSVVWLRSDNPLLRTLSHFSDNLRFRSQLKTRSDDMLKALNPFNVNIVDPKMVYLNSYFRNTFFFNRNHRTIGAEWTFSYNKNKNLMINGYEGRQLRQNIVKVRWNITRKYLLEMSGESGNKTAFSEYFDTRNFDIDFTKVKTKFTLQPSRRYRISVLWSNSQKTNNPTAVNGERATGNTISLLGKLNNPGKGNLTAIVSYIDWKYNGADGNQLAFEMLEGYRTGANVRWNISYNRTLLGNLQLTVVYDGRKPAGTNVIHTGTIQLRAFF